MSKHQSGFWKHIRTTDVSLSVLLTVLLRVVSQGAVLEPILVKLYVNDMNKMTECDIIQNADDTILLRNSQNNRMCKESLENNITNLLK